MKAGLLPGVSREVSFVVTEAMCPAFDSVVVHRVCATWTLVEYMEKAGRLVLVDFLEPHEEGVGSHVTCDHLAAASVGSTVRVVAITTGATERELVCAVDAYCGTKKIATGSTVQKIFPRSMLKRLLGE
ncbi:MAG TPA: hypothetical protein VNT79_18635 [Phycisphaerae bacterium]|nr:hypothetical protein [Phycisphaerae bacterium]